MDQEEENEQRESSAMTLPISSRLTERPVWRALENHYQSIKDVHLRQLFAEEMAQRPKAG